MIEDSGDHVCPSCNGEGFKYVFDGKEAPDTWFLDCVLCTGKGYVSNDEFLEDDD